MGLLLLILGEIQSAQAQAYKVLYTFSGGADGGYPQYGRLTMDAAGNLYGTTANGGNLACELVNGCGVVFKVTPASGEEKVLYTFTGAADGANPWGGLIRDRTGNLYGTTAFGGGANNDGVIFQVDPAGNETVLHSFGATDGANPTGDLVADSSGNLYGTTMTGGSLVLCSSGCGVIFKYNQAGEFEVLHNFANSSKPDGANPTHPLTLDASGNIYGTTENGGNASCDNYEGHEAVETFVEGCGTVFKLSSMGETPLYRFNAAPDGSDPRTALIRDASGNFYGTTFYGGVYGNGTVFKLDTAGTETVLYNFQGLADGANPWGGLVRDASGNLYGTANHGGGPCGCGTVFRLDTEGDYTVLHTFAGTDGQYPEAPLRIYQQAIYGTTSGGGTLSDGTSGTGTVFEISVP